LVLHAFGTAPQVTFPLGDYAAKTLGYKRMAIVAEDFTYGYEGAGGFQLAFEAAGGKVVQKLWPPLNAPEYAPYLAQIKGNIDGIYMGFAGINPLRFLKQFNEYGLKGKVGVLGNTTSTDEGILKLMGDEAVGVYTAGWYAAGLDTPDNKKFVAGINTAYHHDPGFYTAGPYTALLIIEEALKSTGGNTADAAAFLKAMRDVRLTPGPIGPVRLDEYGTRFSTSTSAKWRAKTANSRTRSSRPIRRSASSGPTSLRNSSRGRRSRATTRRAYISNSVSAEDTAFYADALVYLGSRSSNSIDTPSGARIKQTRTPGRTVVGSRVNSTPLAFRSAAIASMPLTDSPK
jgi:substrate-binding family protein